MSKSSDALKDVQQRWREMEAAYPREHDLGDDDRYTGISYSVISAVLEEWKSILDTLDAKNSWAHTPEMTIHDHTISASISRLNGQVSNGKSNGIAWLLDSGFLNEIAAINSGLDAISSKRISVSRNLAKALASSAESSANKVIEGAKAVDEILSKRETAKANADEIDSLASHAQDVQGQLEQYQKSIEALEVQAKASAASAESALGEASQAKSGATRSKGEIDALKDSAIEREAELEDRVREVNESLDALKNEADAAKQSVKEALRLARDQGLAKSFQDRSRLLNSERRLWIFGFIGAGAVLLVTGITFVLEIHELTFQSVTATLLKKAALIAPAVWVGWYCAKQITRVGKVQEDYEYKAASALAYQSYKDEAAINPDSGLRDELLKRAIETFGENPVRLYEERKDEANSPLTELLAKLKPEKLADLLGAALAKALEKR